MKYYQQLLIAIIAVAVLWSAEPVGERDSWVPSA
jgi:hypothetical protein